MTDRAIALAVGTDRGTVNRLRNKKGRACHYDLGVALMSLHKKQTSTAIGLAKLRERL